MPHHHQQLVDFIVAGTLALGGLILPDHSIDQWLSRSALSIGILVGLIRLWKMYKGDNIND